jgi:biliverdin reductase
MEQNLRVGIVGTGFVARLRAEALGADKRAKLVAVTGFSSEHVQQFAADFNMRSYPDWASMLHEAQLDLVFICTINRDHATIAHTALSLNLHTVVEYPLAYSLEEARLLLQLAEQRQRLLHVEHIELLSGVHLLLQRELPSLGHIFATTYSTITATRPAPNRWTYEPALFGFPLVGAVSRIHRLTHLLGPVTEVSCYLRYEGSNLPERFTSCYCTAHLSFTSGTLATITYAKGESLWRTQRLMEFHGHRGAILIDGEQGVLLRPDGAHPLDVGSRRGLFQQDTRMVLDHLEKGSGLYITAKQILHGLAIALAAQKSSETHEVVRILD